MARNLERCQVVINIQLKETNGKFTFSGKAVCDLCDVKVIESFTGDSKPGFNYDQRNIFSNLRTRLDTQRIPQCRFMEQENEKIRKMIERNQIDQNPVGLMDSM